MSIANGQNCEVDSECTVTNANDYYLEDNIYPNPVRDILYLQTDEKWTKAEIYDISGRIMRVVSLDSKFFDVNGLKSGTYFVRLKNGEKEGRVKFVKM